MLKKPYAIKRDLKLKLTRVWKELETYCCCGCKYCNYDNSCDLIGRGIERSMYDLCVKITPVYNYDKINYIYIYVEKENTD